MDDAAFPQYFETTSARKKAMRHYSRLGKKEHISTQNYTNTTKIKIPITIKGKSSEKLKNTLIEIELCYYSAEDMK